MSQSFREWSQTQPLSEALSRAEAGVRAKPQDAGARWLLFELLCVLGQWDRALKQLQTWAGLSKEFDSTAHVMRGLIRAEHQRNEVFAGTRVPATVMVCDTTDMPGWMTGLADALRLSVTPGDGALEASDLVREAALAQAPETAGRSNLQPDSFAWITDADTRLGPVCEVVLVGAYRWLAFADIASVTKAAPTGLLDLVWSQVDIVLSGGRGEGNGAGRGNGNGAGLKGYMPMRYPVSADPTQSRDALLLARETVWHDVGRTGVHARGQKMWMTDVGDMALLDLRDCDFGNGMTTTQGDADAATH